MPKVLGLLAVLVLTACGGPAASVPSEPPGETVVAADFTNGDGKLVCPVMGDVIASKAQAVGHTEHDGKTYWFCCDSCQHMFADDPERYAEGRFLAHLQAEHDGRFGDCRHLL